MSESASSVVSEMQPGALPQFVTGMVSDLAPELLCDCQAQEGEKGT